MHLVQMRSRAGIARGIWADRRKNDACRAQALRDSTATSSAILSLTSTHYAFESLGAWGVTHPSRAHPPRVAASSFGLYMSCTFPVTRLARGETGNMILLVLYDRRRYIALTWKYLYIHGSSSSRMRQIFPLPSRGSALRTHHLLD